MLSNSAPEVVLDRDDGGRLWIFEDTPRLSTYVVVVNAGPFHELREERGGHSLGLYCRQSLRPLPRAGRRGAVPAHRAGAGVLRRAVRASRSRRSATTRSSCPTSAARWRTGAASPGPTACSAAAPPTLRRAELVARRAAARDGAHVVRRPGDHALVGRPVAQRGVRVVRVHLGGGVGDRVHRRAGPPSSPASRSRAYQQDMGPASHPIRSRGARRRRTRSRTSTPSPTQGPGGAAPADGLRRPRRRSSRGCAATSREHAWGNAELADLMRRDRRRRPAAT